MHFTLSDDDDDDVPQLSAETMAVLQEFLEEQVQKEKGPDLRENWQLSQFWYDEATTEYLSKTITSLCKNQDKIALISCPTLYKPTKSKIEDSKNDISVQLFEYDKRFSIHGEDFIFYDYNNPLELEQKYEHNFDVVIADPPFLSNECLTKVAKTIQYIGKNQCKILVCTGAVMETLANELLNVKKCQFEPKHYNNLGNEFICLSNFGEI